MAVERTTQATCGPALPYAAGQSGRATPRRSERPSSVRRLSSVYQAPALSASTYAAALAASSDGVLLFDRAGVIVYANPAAETFFSDDALPGRYLAELIEVDRRTVTGIFRGLLRSRRWCGRLCVRSARPDVEVTVQRVGPEPGAEEHFCAVLHAAGRAAAQVDAPRENCDEQPGQASALQRVASEIAHDFNNQIAVILNYTFVLLRHMPDGSPLKAHVAEMQAAAWRASHVAQAIHRAIVAR